MKFMEMVGGSISMSGSGRGSTGSVKVTPTVTSSMPATATISPVEALSTGTFWSPR